MASSLFTGSGSLITYREPLYSDTQMSMYYGQRSFSNESKIDKRIISRNISVVSVPGLKNYKGYDLEGGFNLIPEEIVSREAGAC